MPRLFRPAAAAASAATAIAFDWTAGGSEIAAADLVDLSTEGAGATAAVSGPSLTTDGRAYMKPHAGGMSSGNATTGVWVKEGATDSTTGNFVWAARVGFGMDPSHGITTNLNASSLFGAAEKVGAGFDAAADKWFAAGVWGAAQWDAVAWVGQYHTASSWEGTWASFTKTGMARMSQDVVIQRVATSLTVWICDPSTGFLTYVNNHTLAADADVRPVWRAACNDADAMAAMVHRRLTGLAIEGQYLVVA